MKNLELLIKYFILKSDIYEMDRNEFKNSIIININDLKNNNSQRVISTLYFFFLILCYITSSNLSHIRRGTS